MRMNGSTTAPRRVAFGVPWGEAARRAAGFLLGAVFVYAGAVKLADPAAFAVVVDAYGLVPRPALPLVAIGLPAMEVAAGIAVVLDWRGGLEAVLAMTLLFLGVLGYGIAVGLDVDCGCYGPGDPEGEALHGLRDAFARDLGLLAVAAFLYWRRRARRTSSALGRRSPTSKRRGK